MPSACTLTLGGPCWKLQNSLPVCICTALHLLLCATHPRNTWGALYGTNVSCSCRRAAESWTSAPNPTPHHAPLHPVATLSMKQPPRLSSPPAFLPPLPLAATTLWATWLRSGSPLRGSSSGWAPTSL